MVNETDPTTTSNYFQVAVEDDQQAIEKQGESSTSISASTNGDTAALDKAAKAEIRRQRIEAAVQRSKSEYKSEHAYTERGWFNDGENQRNVLSKDKVDKQHLEYITTSLYYASPPDYTEALRLIMKNFDPNPTGSKPKPMGGLNRELLDTALRCSLAISDAESAVKLADSTKNMWKGQFAGISALASDAYLLAGRPIDALTPLFVSASSFGLHQPLLTRLSSILESHVSVSSSSSAEKQTSTYENIHRLIGILDKVIIWKSVHLQKPLFQYQTAGKEPNTNTNTNSTIDMSFSDQPPNSSGILEELQINEHDTQHQDLISGVKGTVNRLNKGFKNDPSEDVVEKSVREL
ncbi:hypothetical protein L486_02712 [Kwoniella mangroviensis CBS 10435]|uniref:Uncharacterized protein n=1 Tax=Kwoniella mangroviensis CBS 10435 TaxID=1331196 RepID=A0A1B9IWY5_9TREE|nr:uncharacterized protein I203_01451 [Kwoniella mangroviensis CBS 8507]OCF60039.1 hypothetical protein L486_02712 [Kwoniella mangroviensis CBS 10435]OCF69587.1 hypothetical protein I203_01451 [Kwoniella mangroviensis CBS 8507]OCF70957.1 hypothetical protein I204_08392 [Kwoniella mangroviensis CBS 8886]